MCRQSWPLVNRCRQSDSDSEWILPTLFSVKFIDKGLDKCQCTAPNPMQKVTSHFYMHILSVSSRHYHGAALTFTVANCWVAFERFPFLFFLLLLVLLISHCLIKASASNLSSTRFVGRFFSSTPPPTRKCARAGRNMLRGGARAAPLAPCSGPFLNFVKNTIVERKRLCWLRKEYAPPGTFGCTYF